MDAEITHLYDIFGQQWSMKATTNTTIFIALDYIVVIKILKHNISSVKHGCEDCQTPNKVELRINVSSLEILD